MNTKLGRPFAGDADALQANLSQTQRSLEELSTLLTGLSASRTLYAQALEQCYSDLGNDSTIPERKPKAGVAAVHTAELEAVAKWYAKHSAADRAHLLMQPDALQKEFDRLWLWMPKYMQYNAELLIPDSRAAARHDKHKDHSRWLRTQQLLLHNTAVKALRARRIKCVPLLFAAKGLDRYYKHMKSGLAEQDIKLREGLHHGVIRRLKVELVSWVPRAPFQQMKQLKLLYLDNWDMYQKVSHTSRQQGVVKKAVMLHAIVVAEEMIDASLFPSPAPTASLFKPTTESTWKAVDSIPNESGVNEHLFNYFIGFVCEARIDIKKLWERPSPSCDSQTSGRSLMISHPVHTDLCASSKADMADCYQRLEETLGDCYKIYVEDWACFAISSNFQARNPDGWLKYLFWGGETHRQMHSNDAVIHVWWEHICKPCAMLLLRNEIKLKFSADDFNSKEQFVRLIAVAAFQWLITLSGVPENVLVDPKQLLSQTKANLPAHELIHFLIYGGTFALADKAAMRIASADDLDWAWTYTSILARGCNKTNYAKYGVMMHRILNDTHPWVGIVMKNYRTFRVTDRPCTGVGKDSGTEKVQYKYRIHMIVAITI